MNHCVLCSRELSWSSIRLCCGYFNGAALTHLLLTQAWSVVMKAEYDPIYVIRLEKGSGVIV